MTLQIKRTARGRALLLGCALVGCSSSSPVNPGTGAAGGGGGGIGGAAGTAGSGGAAGTAGSGGGAPGAAGSVAPVVDAGSEGGGAGGGTPLDAGSDAVVADGPSPDAPRPNALGPAGGACPVGATYGNPLPQNRTATLIRGNFGELEGPVWVASQKALYFCEAGKPATAGHIHKYTPADGKIVAFLDNVGVGGLAMDPQGQLVAATYDTRHVSRIDPVTGQRTDVAGGSMYMNKPFNEVNDVVVRSDGNIYFSDPAYGTTGPAQDVMAFYRLSPAGVVTRLVAAKDANGVALSPDGAWLYLATTGGPALQRLALAADGSPVGAATTWTDPASDGIAVDCAGNLYLSAALQIKVISPTDQPLGSITGLGTGYVTNSAFGGTEGKTLFITTSQALYQIALNVPGFPN